MRKLLLYSVVVDAENIELSVAYGYTMLFNFHVFVFCLSASLYFPTQEPAEWNILREALQET